MKKLISEYQNQNLKSRIMWDTDRKQYAVEFMETVTWFNFEDDAEIFAEDCVLKIVDSGPIVARPL